MKENRKAKIEKRGALARYLNAISRFRIPLFDFRFSNFFARITAFALALGCPVAAFAQGCPLCYNTAAAAKASGIQALRSGILILIVPPLLICAGVLWHGIKARNTYNEPQPEQELAARLGRTAPSPEGWESETRKSKLENRKSKSEDRNSKIETRNSKLDSRMEEQL